MNSIKMTEGMKIKDSRSLKLQMYNYKSEWKR